MVPERSPCRSDLMRLSGGGGGEPASYSTVAAKLPFQIVCVSAAVDRHAADSTVGTEFHTPGS